MPDEAVIKTNDEKITFKRAENYLRVYTNNCQMNTTLWDVRLVFGDLTPKEVGADVEQFVELVMSPHHAKALTNLLVNTLKEYEQKVGEIKLPGAKST